MKIDLNKNFCEYFEELQIPAHLTTHSAKN